MRKFLETISDLYWGEDYKLFRVAGQQVGGGWSLALSEFALGVKRSWTVSDPKYSKSKYYWVGLSVNLGPLTLDLTVSEYNEQ